MSFFSLWALIGGLLLTVLICYFRLVGNKIGAGDLIGGITIALLRGFWALLKIICVVVFVALSVAIALEDLTLAMLVSLIDAHNLSQDMLVVLFGELEKWKNNRLPDGHGWIYNSIFPIYATCFVVAAFQTAPKTISVATNLVANKEQKVVEETDQEVEEEVAEQTEDGQEPNPKANHDEVLKPVADRTPVIFQKKPQ